MTDEQFKQMIDLLIQIEDNTSCIVMNLDSIEEIVGIRKLDDFYDKMEEMNNTLEKIVDLLDK